MSSVLSSDASVVTIFYIGTIEHSIEISTLTSSYRTLKRLKIQFKSLIGVRWVWYELQYNIVAISNPFPFPPIATNTLLCFTLSQITSVYQQCVSWAKQAEYVDINKLKTQENVLKYILILQKLWIQFVAWRDILNNFVTVFSAVLMTKLCWPVWFWN